MMPFDLGLEVGIVAGSDDHKARPGASWPGASLFGALGGLTCLLMPELTREARLRLPSRPAPLRYHGQPPALECERLIFKYPIVRFVDDPCSRTCAGISCGKRLMGDIVHSTESGVLVASRGGELPPPSNQLDFFNGKRLISTWRPYGQRELGRRIRVLWCGAEYRGRFRMSTWDGTAKLTGNTFTSASPINFFNPDKQLRMLSPGSWHGSR